jgi:hypothetical protein
VERRAIRPEERESLVRFARLELSLDELFRQTNGMLELDFDSGIRRFTSHFLFVDHGIRIQSADIDRALSMRREGLLSEKDLVRWATMLIMNDAYIWGSEDDGDDEISNTLNDLSIGGLNLYLQNRSQPI